MAALAQARQAMAANYKALKEDFVSNLTGGEITEINYVTAVAPAAVLLWSALQARQAFFMPYTPIAFAVDFLLNVGCILLATTLHSSNPILLNILIIAPVTLLLAMPRVSSRAKKANSPAAKPAGATKTKVDLLPKKAFVTTYRGCMMIVTCVAILAVDFHIFPRRFAKVENWGTSLMDLGVGSFVFAAGLVAARPVLRAKMTQTISPLGTRLFRSVCHSLPLLVLGFIRLYSVKGLDYAEHVTEYGVHWNFFFTLAFLPPFVALFESLFHQTNSFAALAIGLGICYQLVLEFTSLKAFILTAQRTELISQNREGICSFFGYLAIFLAGQSTGTYVLPGRKYGGGRWSHQKDVLMKLAGWCAVWSLLYILTTDYRTLNLTVSRRMANLPYIFWVAALNCGQLFAFSTIEAAFFPRATVSDEETYRFATSRVLHAYNRNGLAVFLIANLLTGLVNMSIKTLLVRDQAAMGILIGYIAVVTGVAVGLDAFDIEIKL